MTQSMLSKQLHFSQGHGAPRHEDVIALFRRGAAAIIEVVSTMTTQRHVQDQRVHAVATHLKVVVAAIDGGDLSSAID